MNMWIVLLLGIIIGWIVGILLVRQNYETCRSQIEAMKQELEANESQLQKTEQALAELTHDIAEKEAQLQTIIHE